MRDSLLVSNDVINGLLAGQKVTIIRDLDLVNPVRNPYVDLFDWGQPRQHVVGLIERFFVTRFRDDGPLMVVLTIGLAGRLEDNHGHRIQVADKYNNQLELGLQPGDDIEATFRDLVEELGAMITGKLDEEMTATIKKFY